MAQSLHVFFVQWGRGSTNKSSGRTLRNCAIFESTPTLTFWPKRSAIKVAVLSSEYGISIGRHHFWINSLTIEAVFSNNMTHKCSDRSG